MTIKDWPAMERPREKLIQQGAQGLSNAELLAIFLRTGTKGKSAVELARELLVHFGSLSALLNASLADFVARPGMGEAKFAQLQSVVELTRRYLSEELQAQDVIRSPECVRDYLQCQLRHLPQEKFCCLYLNTQNQIIAFETLFSGTLDAAAVYPREVIRLALQHNAKSFIAVHNHPSGSTEPSDADVAITRKLKNAAAWVDIQLLDHMIVAGSQVVSMAELGLI